MRKVSEIKDDKFYFICYFVGYGYSHCKFAGTRSNGKFFWTLNPGSANRYKGDEALQKSMSDPDLWAIEVPSDADKRWKRKIR